MRIIYIIVFIFCFYCIQAQNIIFQDNNFKKALLDKVYNSAIIDKNDDGEIQIDEAKNYSEDIYVNGDRFVFGISNLYGLEYFENIKNLYLYDCDINTIDLSKFKIIESIFISKTNLSHIDISQNKNLKHLTISNNKMEHLDISNNDKLITLNCSNNKLTTINVEKNLQLTDVDISNNEIVVLNVNNLKFLKKLFCNNNKIQLLNINSNVFLKELNCASNFIQKLDTFNNKEISVLNCSDNKLTSLKINSVEFLEELNFGNNKISEIDLKHCRALKSLKCYTNRLKHIDLSYSLELQEIQIQKNQIKELDFSNHSKLKIVKCFANNLTVLNMKNGNNLNITQTKPNIYSKEFSNDFDATNNPNLKCIKVDNLKYLVYDKYWQKDEQTYYCDNCHFNIIPERLSQKKQEQFKKELLESIYNLRKSHSESNKQKIKIILDSIGSKNLGDTSKLFYESIDLNIPVLYWYLIDNQYIDLKAPITISKQSYSNNNHGFWSFLAPKSSYEYTEETPIHKVVLNSDFKTVEMIEYFKRKGVLDDSHIKEYLKLKYKRRGEYKYTEKLFYKYYKNSFKIKNKPSKKMYKWSSKLYNLNNLEISN